MDKFNWYFDNDIKYESSIITVKMIADSCSISERTISTLIKKNPDQKILIKNHNELMKKQMKEVNQKGRLKTKSL